MLRPGIAMVLILLVQGFALLCPAKELAFPVIQANGKSFTNVVVTATSKNRVIIQHSGGITTVHADDLNKEAQRQLIEADVIRDPAADPKKKKKEKEKSATPGDPSKKLIAADGDNDSFAAQIGSRFESEASSRSGVAPEKVLSMVTRGIFFGIVGFGVGLYLLACWCLFRICRKGRGNGSLLVFLPLLRWLPLADAARMKRGLIWVPTFAMVGLFLPPPLPEVNGFTFCYALMVGTLWLASAVLFAIWCMKICKQLECSAFWGLLLMSPLAVIAVPFAVQVHPLFGLSLLIAPVLTWIPLLYLAFSEEKSELVKPAAGPNRIQLAI